MTTPRHDRVDESLRALASLDWDNAAHRTDLEFRLMREFYSLRRGAADERRPAGRGRALLMVAGIVLGLAGVSFGGPHAYRAAKRYLIAPAGLADRSSREEPAVSELPTGDAAALQLSALADAGASDGRGDLAADFSADSNEAGGNSGIDQPQSSANGTSGFAGGDVVSREIPGAAGDSTQAKGPGGDPVARTLTRNSAANIPVVPATVSAGTGGAAPHGAATAAAADRAKAELAKARPAASERHLETARGSGRLKLPLAGQKATIQAGENPADQLHGVAISLSPDAQVVATGEDGVSISADSVEIVTETTLSPKGGDVGNVLQQSDSGDHVSTLLYLADSGAAASQLRARLVIQTQTQPSPDWNEDGTLDSPDYLDFVDDFMHGEADFNRDGGTDSSDYFDFAESYLTGEIPEPQILISTIVMEATTPSEQAGAMEVFGRAVEVPQDSRVPLFIHLSEEMQAAPVAGPVAPEPAAAPAEKPAPETPKGK